MYLFLVLEYSTRLLLSLYKPFELEGQAPGGIGNYVLVPLFIVMFILSLRNNQQ
jgi:hypothetical protein